MGAARDLDLTGVDALVISACVQMPSLDLIEAAESEFGVPVAVGGHGRRVQPAARRWACPSTSPAPGGCCARGPAGRLMRGPQLTDRPEEVAMTVSDHRVRGVDHIAYPDVRPGRHGEVLP